MIVHREVEKFRRVWNANVFARPKGRRENAATAVVSCRGPGPTGVRKKRYIQCIFVLIRAEVEARRKMHR